MPLQTALFVFWMVVGYQRFAPYPHHELTMHHTVDGWNPATKVCKTTTSNGINHQPQHGGWLVHQQFVWSSLNHLRLFSIHILLQLFQIIQIIWDTGLLLPITIIPWFEMKPYRTQALNIAMMLLGRIVAGFSVGLLSGNAPVYTSEIAPPNLRGALVTGFQFAITVGAHGWSGVTMVLPWNNNDISVRPLSLSTLIPMPLLSWSHLVLYQHTGISYNQASYSVSLGHNHTMMIL